jgi:hypothetical protein
VEKLLNPEIGLMVWTVVTFAGAGVCAGAVRLETHPGGVGQLGKTVSPKRRSADKAQKAAEDLRQEYEAQVAGVEAKTRELLAQAEAQARALKEDLARDRPRPKQRMFDETRKKLGRRRTAPSGGTCAPRWPRCPCTPRKKCFAAGWTSRFKTA